MQNTRATFIITTHKGKFFDKIKIRNIGLGKAYIRLNKKKGDKIKDAHLFWWGNPFSESIRRTEGEHRSKIHDSKASLSRLGRGHTTPFPVHRCYFFGRENPFGYILYRPSQTQ